jgi:RNAse (barnase) inhibitor barstar
MQTIVIDCDGAKSAAEVWQRYIDAAKPEGASLFGRNLDAFWDAIEHGGPGWPGEAKLVFRNSSRLATLEVGSGSSLLDGLRRIANEATQTRIELA